MTASAHLRLYGTLGCHLCEEARERVTPAAARAGATLEEVDVAEEPALAQRYGARIPVLERVADGAELDWPFSAEAVRELVGLPRRRRLLER